MAYHNVVEPVKHKSQQQQETKMLPLANTIAAATRIRQLFESKKLSYGILGGLEMLCLGHQRELPGLHIAYEDKDLDRIRTKLQADRRVHIPDGMNSLIPTKLLVQTGPAYLDTGCTRPGTVEVYLIPSGSYGTPQSGTLANNTTLLSLRSDGILKTYKGLNMLYLMKTMLEYCTIADLTWEPRKDIVFLCQHYGEQVQSIRSQLDADLILNTFLRSSFFSRLSFGDQRRCYQVVRAQDPPPLVAQIPSVGQSDLPRPRVDSHTGPPTGLMNPSHAQKAVPSKKHATYHRSEPLGPAIAPVMPPSIPSSTQDSRNRYRRVSNLGREGQPGNTPQARSISMQHKQEEPALSNNPQHFAPQAMANGRASQCGPGMSPQANQTMRSSSAGNPGYLASRISTQPGLVTNPSSSQQSQRQYLSSPPQVPDIPLSYSQRQQHIQEAQQRLCGGTVPQQPQVQNIPITNKPSPLQPRHAHQPPQQTSRKPIPNPQPTATNQSHPKTNTKRTDSGSGLQLVGPQGLWAPSPPILDTLGFPLPPSTTKTATNTTTAHGFPLPPTTTRTTANSTPIIVSELPAPSPRRLPRQNSSTILAELSANIDDAIKTATTPPLSHSPPPHHDPCYKHAASGSVELPASLKIRFSTLPSSVATTTTESTKNAGTTAIPPLPLPGTNASRYSQILSTPSSTPVPASTPNVGDLMKSLVNSPTPTTPPLTPAPLSLYKAYQPLPPPARAESWDMLGSAELPASPPVSPPVEDAWIDVLELAREYQMEMPGFEDGYGSG
ncbi:hypothetical protein P3342_010313 [Pyrenophora teres f. teres]|uniref:Uncharacterized protein n=1 Tax=Pyrenophora teres f. teres TaxID=97479 RepID=A0A6S6WEF5_9PLEO|nr:hypothetical protein P3342_010313 [Pyrenophora teres f. teres]CAE7199771.1 hypothetical protein PTTW11_08528 [Pyrenophora teres f. teres]